MAERKQYRQGDVFIEKVCELSKDRLKRLKRVQGDGQRVILALGEVTGHAHAVALKERVLPEKLKDAKPGSVVIPDPKDVELYEDDNGDLFLRVKEKKGATVVHEEHAPIRLPKGYFRVWRQREYSPEEIRVIRD